MSSLISQNLKKSRDADHIPFRGTLSINYHVCSVTPQYPLADPRGAGMGHAPLAAWASAQNALKVTIFRLKIKNIFWGGAMSPPQTPASFPLHILNYNVVSNMLILSPRAICIHTTASFPKSNGFWRLKRFTHSMEE